MINKKIISDSIFSILSSMVLVLTLQLFVLPLLSKDMNLSNFGIIVTIIAIRNVLVQVFSGTLNNTRLLEQSKIRFASDVESGFNFFVLISNIFANFFCIVAISLLVDSKILNTLDYALLIITLTIAVFNNYFSVFFRVNLNYKKIFLMQLIASTGYVIGLLIYKLTGIWVYILLISEILVSVFIFSYLNKLNYNFSLKKIKNFNWKKFFDVYSPLLGSSIINNVVIYFDRFLLNPVLGPFAVTQYYVASLSSKTISLGITPINGVLLSYTSKWRSNISLKKFNIILMVLIIIFLIINIILYFLSPLLIKFFYSNYYGYVKPYINIINLIVSLGILTTMFNPFILKIAGPKTQMKITIFYGIIYIVPCMVLTILFGLWGFCIGALVANIFKLFAQYYYGFTAIKQF